MAMTVLPLALFSLFLFCSPASASITKTVSELLPSDDSSQTYTSEPAAATLRASYIPVQVSRIPLDGPLVELKDGRSFWFLRRHRDGEHHHRFHLRRLVDVEAPGKVRKLLVGVRKLGPDCGGMGGGSGGAGGPARRFSVLLDRD